MDNNRRTDKILARLWWLRPILFLGKWTALCFGPLVVGIVLASYLHPKMDMRQLYQYSLWASRITLPFVAAFVLFFWSLKVASDRSDEFRKASSAGFGRLRAWFYVGAICIALAFLQTAVTGFRHVYPDGDRWISTGHAGSWEVSELTAKTYLWRDIRWYSLMVLLGIYLLGLAVQSCVRGIGSDKT